MEMDEKMAAALTIGTVVSLALGSSVVGALVTQGATWLREGKTAKRETAYLALRIASVFERFAEDAAGFVGQINDFTGGSAEGVSTDLPSLRALPDEKERWRDLDVFLTARIIGFEEKVRSRQGGIGNTWEHASPDDGIAEAKAFAILLATGALRLAGDVRKAYGLPPFNTTSHWPDFLSGERDELPGHWRDEV
jgi:hypothetical protein